MNSIPEKGTFILAQSSMALGGRLGWHWHAWNITNFEYYEHTDCILLSNRILDMQNDWQSSTEQPNFSMMQMALSVAVHNVV